MEMIIAAATGESLIYSPLFWLSILGVTSWVLLFVGIRNSSTFMTVVFGLLALGFSVAAGIMFYPILIS